MMYRTEKYWLKLIIQNHGSLKILKKSNIQSQEKNGIKNKTSIDIIVV